MSAPLPGQLELPLSPEPERLSGWEQIELGEGKPPPERVYVPSVAGSDTSREAAIALKESGGAGRLERAALGLFFEAGPWGLTDEQLDYAGRRAGLAFSTLRPRRVGLCRKGWVEDSGRREQNASGKWASVWLLTKDGEDGWLGC